MARSDPFVETLATVPLFSACSKKELQMVAKSAEHVTVPAGSVVVTEGAAGTEFFVILDGRARVERHGKEVASLKAGSFFGDLALLDRAPRNASVIAESELELAKLGQRAFDGLLEHPGFSKKLLAGLARRLREADARNP
jgi:CRP/FNR family transcriptional regulator, cyclic AMP receptor protein